ncbi:hypothetical protein KJ611_01500 [Patescibacteria group bacterium]|nr:hypothetical protein [Patescibacteria group bacterium]MBU1705352.1 hypothetical protein [Patescibacteria group bacterium]
MLTNITKASGQVVPFEAGKVRQSILRTGADQKTADAILAQVEQNLKPNISTKQIYQMVRQQLSKEQPWAAARYNLRQGIVRLGPSGFNFEKYVAAVLTAYGYEAETPEGYQGACIYHEVDVTAKKDGRTAFIEAKFRHNFQAQITIKDALATWSRYLDLVDGSGIGLCPHFDEAWIVTNARFTDQVLQYGHCKNMVMIGWNHPRERTFAQMVDISSLYPITVINDLTQPEIDALSKKDLMLCSQLAESKIDQLQAETGLPAKRLESLQALCTEVINGG